jgi:hypothetical protein
MHLLSGGVRTQEKEKTRPERRHSIQVSSLGKDMEKLQLVERKDRVIKEGAEHSKVAADDGKKLVRNLSKKRRNSKQGKFSS